MKNEIITITKILLIVFLSMFDSSVINARSSLCPPLPPLEKGKDDLRMTEKDFTKTRFITSMSYFKNYLPRKLNSEKETKKLISSAEFWVGYRNSLKFIEGYILKQEAILRGGNAQKVFCKFILSAEYVD